MKKLFMFLAVAGLATFGVSCSSSDDNGSDEGKTLSLSADKTSIKEGESVTFTVSESGAELYIDGTKTSGLTQKFDKKGEYKVQAKKSGFKDSNVVTIKVTKEGEPGDSKTLKIEASPGEVGVGEEVTFTVKDNEGTAVKDAVIKLNGTTVSNPWKATEVGTFEFVASKDDYKDGKVTVTVVKKITSLVLTIIDPNDITEDTPIVAEVKDQDGEYVDKAVFNILGQTFEMKGGKISLNGAPEGSHEVFATYQGITSNKETVVVKPGAKPVGTGTVTYDGKSEAADVELVGIINVIDNAGKKYAVWLSQTRTASWTVQHQFITEVTLDANGKIVSGMPAGNNVLAMDMGIFNISDGKVIDEIQKDKDGVPDASAGLKIEYNIKGTGTAPIFADVEVSTGATMKTGKAATVTYSGDAVQAQWQTAANNFVKSNTAVKTGIGLTEKVIFVK